MSSGRKLFVLYTSTKNSDYSPRVCLEVALLPGMPIESTDVDASALLSFYWQNTSFEKWRIDATDPEVSIKRDFKRKIIVRFDT